MKIYIVIVTYNAEKWIDLSVKSVYDQNYNVVVIDNASNDNTVKLIKQYYPKVQLIESTKNSGFGKANNTGLNIALKNGADYVLLLNQDAGVETGTIEKLVNEQQKSPEFWILTPLQRHSKGNCVEANFQKYLKKSGIELENSDESSTIKEMQFANAAIWLMTRNCIETVGGFDPLFPHYGEDNDYVNRLHYWGAKLGLAHTAIGYHERDAEVKTEVVKGIYKSTLGIVGLLKNNNNSLIFNLLKQTGRLIQKLFKFLLKKDFVLFGIYFRSYFKALFQLKKIVSHRKLSKEKGAFLEVGSL